MKLEYRLAWFGGVFLATASLAAGLLMLSSVGSRSWVVGFLTVGVAIFCAFAFVMRSLMLAWYRFIPAVVRERICLGYQLLAGLVYLAMFVVLVRALTGHSYFVALLVAAAFCTAWIPATFFILRQRPPDSKAGRGQFSLRFLLLAILLLALFLGSVDWVLTAWLAGRTWVTRDLPLIRAIAVIVGTLLGFLSVPPIGRLTESVLWIAVWLMRRPRIRSAAADCRKETA